MSEIFRDRTEGALARRQDLLRKRRDELVMMPHAIRRVAVDRAARIAAASAMIAAGLGLLVVSLSPSVARWIASGMPGINPAVISTFVAGAWIVALVAWATSRARSEHRFVVEVMSTVLPGQDLDHDIERLSHEPPDVVARRMAHRLEVASAALPIAAAGFVVPATLVYLAHAIWAMGWPATAVYEQDLASCGTELGISAIAGLVAALAMTHRRARSLHPGVTGVLALVAGAIAFHACFIATAPHLLTVWIASMVATLAGAITFINWRLAAERKAIEADDPAAGSELFTLRGLVASIRESLGRARRHVTPSMVAGAGVFATLAVIAGDPVAFGRTQQASATLPTSSVPNVIDAPRPQAGVSTYSILPTGDGRLRVFATFVDGKPVRISTLSGMSTVPIGWKARVIVRLEEGGPDLPYRVAVTPFPDDPDNIPLGMASGEEQRFATSVCDERVQPFGLLLRPDATPTTGTYHASFLVEPYLELATCQ